MATREQHGAGRDRRGAPRRAQSLIVEHLKLRDVDPPSSGMTPLWSAGGLDLDSIDVLELVTGVERRYGPPHRGAGAGRPDLHVGRDPRPAHITAHRASA